MTDALTVALDYRPALFPGFGIGRYVSNLVPAMLEADPEIQLRLYGVFLRGRRERIANHEFPDNSRATFHGAPIPARWVPWLARVLPISARTFTGHARMFALRGRSASGYRGCASDHRESAPATIESAPATRACGCSVGCCRELR